jgi:glycosyltransferase involved in cell wall biosynthesis
LSEGGGVPERALNIGIDARELCGHPTGVGRYLSGLLDVWATDPALPHRFTLVSPVPFGPSPDWPRDRISVLVDPASEAGTLWEQTRLPRIARQKRMDVWFSPGYTAPLRVPCPSVVAIHDLSFFAHPEWFNWREGLRRRWLTRASARRARIVITISEFSRREIERWLGVPPDRVRLAQPGAPAMAARRVNAAEREPMVLFVGSLFNRRGIARLVRAFAGVALHVPGSTLVLVGDNRTNPVVDPLALARDLGIGDRVEWRAYVAEDELERLYGRARVFAFLSEYEGFAMTPLEALAHDVPSVLLDTPVAREVYGPAARYVTTADRALETALVELLTDERARASLLQHGRSLLTGYSWQRSADVVRQALEDAARP